MNLLQCFSSKFVGTKCGKGWCHWEIPALLKPYHTTALVIIFWCLWVVEFWENECIRCQNDINFWRPSYSKSFCCSFSPAHPSPSVKTCCLELISQLTELGKQMSELQECSLLLMWIMRKGIILNLSDFWFFFLLIYAYSKSAYFMRFLNHHGYNCMSAVHLFKWMFTSRVFLKNKNVLCKNRRNYFETWKYKLSCNIWGFVIRINAYLHIYLCKWY